jgi:amidohydrolase
MKTRLILLLTSTAILSAQTTPVERQAASEILKKIDALQEKIGPTEQAKAMASGKDRDRDRILKRVETLWDKQLRDLSDHIGRNPEVGFKEFASVDTLTKVLRQYGFSVTTGQAGLETAFVGEWKSPAKGKGVTVGLFAEYDALRGTKEPFHGCQHNGQSPAAYASAVALAEFMEKKKIPGTIKIFGTPAEEMGPPAKVIMFDAGVFDGTDLIVRSHGTGETTRNKPGFGVCCLNINEVKYIFEGRPAHQRSSWNGRNALTAAVQFYTSVDHLRPTFRPEAVIQGVIPEGGVAPNVVPDRAVVDYYIRYPDEVYLAHMDTMIANAAHAAALATGTKVTIDRYGSLEELSFAYAEKLDAPEINPEPQRPAGYEETGFVTRDIPGVSVSVFSSSAPGHSYERWLDSMKDVGHTGFLLDAKIMAAILYHYVTDGDFRKTVHTEHETMAKLFNDYLDALNEAYKDEIGGSLK